MEQVFNKRNILGSIHKRKGPLCIVVAVLPTVSQITRISSTAACGISYRHQKTLNSIMKLFFPVLTVLNQLCPNIVFILSLQNGVDI
jgi:Mg2+/Co2+ transporter CorB